MYYEKKLYPLQDKILQIVSDNNEKFYLTGGTALSRVYLNHRYSDDLDFFVNRSTNFVNEVNQIVHCIEQSFIVDKNDITPDLISFKVEGELKVDFVNDVGKHIGEFKKSQIYPRIDSIDNIIANKITALMGRDEVKDVVDIWAIAKNHKINWEKVFTDSNSKSVGIYPPQVAEKLETFPVGYIENINWVDDKKPTMKDFENDIKNIIENMLEINSI